MMIPWIALSLCFALAESGLRKQPNVLFQDSPNITEYGAAGFQLRGLVEFYDTSCDDCLQLHYEKLSKNVPEIVGFYAVNCDWHRSFCETQQVTTFPHFRLYENDTVREISQFHLHPFELMDKLGKVATTKRQYLQKDLYQSLDAILRNIRFDQDNDDLYSRQQAVLDRYLNVLFLTIPAEFNLVHELLKDLQKNMVYLKSKEYKESILEEHAPSDLPSSEAADVSTVSSTTGAWDLYQTVFMGVYDYNSAGFEDERLLVGNVVRIVYDFTVLFNVQHHIMEFVPAYESCIKATECAYHGILSMVSQPDSHKPAATQADWKQLSLWWSELRGPDFPRDCDSCWTDAQHTKRNSELVFRYLKIRFGRYDETSQRYEKEWSVVKRRLEERTSPQLQGASALILLVCGLIARTCMLQNKSSRRRRFLAVDVCIGDPHNKTA